MAKRALAINPALQVEAIKAFYSEENSDQLLRQSDADLVLDCIDSVAAKTHLLATCLHEDIPVITALGAAGKQDPTAVQCTPLPKSYNDRLGKIVRKTLRRVHRFKNADLRRITAIWSPEMAMPPAEDYESPICDNKCICPGGEDKTFSCTKRNIVLGSLVTVTATFGMITANAALQRLRS
jgi:tRNA A37 threonylcarbamoyladenosine dehydratase